jgi:phage gp46-like protein
MTDFRLDQVNLDDIAPGFDWVKLESGVLDESQALASAVLVALGTDKQADASDVLPNPRSSDRRGWWGDDNAADIWGGWPIGSRLWLLKRAKIVGAAAREGSTTTRVRVYLLECLQPFVSNKICSKVVIDSITVDKSNRRIVAVFTMFRGPKSAIQMTYQPLWEEMFPGE